MDPTAHLNPTERKRYEEKIKLIGVDPYKLKKSDFTTNKDFYPSLQYPDIVNYLVLSRSAYTTDQFMAYKSLDAYRFFTSGWVREPLVAVINNLHVISARVSLSIFIYVYIVATLLKTGHNSLLQVS